MPGPSRTEGAIGHPASHHHRQMTRTRKMVDDVPLPFNLGYAF